MQNLKFFTLMRTLKKEEVPAFHKYLKQLHGGEDIALKVFEYARKLYPDFQDEKKLDMEYAYPQIFGSALSAKEDEQKKQSKNMLNALSDLYLWLKDFLLCEKVRRDALDNQVLWLEVLEERGLRAEFSRQATRLYTETKASLPKDTKGYLGFMAASYYHYHHLSTVRPSPAFTTLQQCVDTLEASAETIILRMACDLATLRKVRPAPIAELPSQALETSAAQEIKNSPLLLLYRDIYQLVVAGQEEKYTQIEATLVQRASQLNSDELHGILSYLHNYAAIQIRNGKEAIFGKRLHQLNKFGLQNGFFNRKGEISATQFTNIVNTACSVKDFDWATSFISGHSGFLPAQVRLDTVLLAQAIVCLEKKDYQQALTLIQSTEFRDVHHVARSRMMVLKIHIHLREDEDKTLNYCAASKAVLDRHRKPPTEAVEAALAFIQLVKILVLENVEQQELINRIKKAPQLYYRAWLLEQAARYKGRYVPRRRNK